ncbi:MAG: hypothetical protein MJ240_01210 [Kiritimatiellae bacterium]|nr:hypothetical protein [Kiritimatiellia bacterium]
MSEYVPIPEEKAQIALATCLQDPSLARYYENAPEGARPYIALEFYLNVYGEEVAAEVAASYYHEVEADLSTADISYLIKHESDPDIRDHLLDLMTSRRPSQGKKMTLRRVADVKAQTTPPPAPMPEPEPVVQMQLRQAETHGAQTEQEQHYANEAVEAVEARWREQERKRRIGAWGSAFKNFVSTLFLLALLAALGWYAYDHFLKGKDLGNGDKSDTELTEYKFGDKAAREEARAKQEEERRQKEAALAEARRREMEAAAEARKKAEAERLAERQKEEEARKAIRERKDGYEQILRQFSTATLDYWKNAPKDERPGKAKTPMTFHCLVPMSADGRETMLLELFCEPGKPMAVKRLSADADPVEMALDEFNKLIAQTPYLVMRGERAYFCSQKKGASELAVPITGEQFSPSKEMFGDLYEAMSRLRFKRPTLSWQVSFLPKDEETPVEICTAAYGEWVSRGRFFDKIKKIMSDQAGAREQRKAVAAAARKLGRKRTVVLYDGSTIRRTIDGVTQVPRSFQYNGSNRHKYYWDTHAYRDEVRKEEAARAKWQSLYDEARRQEEAERDVERARTTSVSVSIDSQEVEDVLNAGKVVFKPVE